ncbi:MAG: arsenosugar biosynthesis radical SAM protein ArsS [Chlamydiota bacterium]|nr:arsenosugar biosynthesis radical SAM protein ArsS [Chlamydiota bacterium]
MSNFSALAYDIPSFSERLGGKTLTRTSLETLQINLGKYCNQACVHCHVDAGPTRKEMMDPQTASAVIRFLKRTSIKKLDITGGAPELFPVFDDLVRNAFSLDVQMMVRTNFTVIFEPGKEYMPDLLKEHHVHIIGSLPCYTAENVDVQRGKGAFEKSIRAIRKLNHLGYGHVGSGLILDLVYNPVGDYLPPEQKGLERDYKKRLFDDFGVIFNMLYTLTNMPILRFRHFLEGSKKLDAYMRLLADHFNPDTLDLVMCRNLVSMDWQGYFYDCDFNQMLDMPLMREDGTLIHVANAGLEDLIRRPIHIDEHCYGCTAGCGSSCGGTLI